MGRSKGSKNKSHSDNVGAKSGKEPNEALDSDTRFKKVGEENRTDKSSELAADKKQSPSAKDFSQDEIFTKEDASDVDERGKDLTYYKNKFSSMRANIRALQKKGELQKAENAALKAENAALKAENSQLSLDLAELQSKYENLKKGKSEIVDNSEEVPMEIDSSQDDKLGEQKNKEADVQYKSLQNKRNTPMNWYDDEPSTPVGSEQARESLDEEPGTSGDVNQFKIPRDAKDMRRSSDPKQPLNSSRSIGGKHTENAKQPSMSSHYGQSSYGKQLSARGSHPDVRDRGHGYVGRVGHDKWIDNQSRQPGKRNEWNSNQNCTIADVQGQGCGYVDRGRHAGWTDRQSRQPGKREAWKPNQNYQIGYNRSTGRMKLEAPAEYKRVREVDGNLFDAPEDNSLAHCVAEDMRMGSGIAITFRQKFKHVEELLDQGKRQGDVAVLEDSSRYIYYLVTKCISTGKPTMDTLERSLKAMRDHVMEHNVSKIAMPRIGCGLDRLEWSRVKPLIENVFSGMDVTITVYNYREDDAASKPTNYVVLKEAQYPVVNIESFTAILCLCAVDGSVDPVLESLNRKFHFLNKYQSANKTLGSVFDIEISNYLICILFVKEKTDDVLSFRTLAQTLVQARKIIDKHKYEYVALEAYYDQHDDLIMEKIITILRNCFSVMPGKEVWVCWPGK